MKKNVLGLSLAVLSIFGLTGCKQGDGKTEVIWWNNYQTPDLSTTTEEEARKNSNYREYYYAKDLIEAFEAANPTIKITQVYKGSYSDIKSAVDAGVTAGNIPAMVSCYADSAYAWYESNVVKDMSSVVEELEKDSDYNQKYLSIEKNMYNGKVLTLPYSKSGETFVYNESVFNKVGAGKAGTDTTDSDGNAVYTAPVASESKAKYDVPTNWDELISTAKQIKTDFKEVFENQYDKDGYFTAVPFCWDSAENMIISLLKNADINYTSSGDKASDRVLFNNDQAKELVVQLKKWNNEGLICTQNQLPITNASKGYHAYGSNLFCNGKIFMSMSSTAGARYFTNDGFLANMTKGLAWGNGDQKDVKVMSQGPSLCFLRNKDSKVEDAAVTFYKYLTNTDNSAKLAVNTAYFPLRTSSKNVESVKALTDAANTKPAENATASVKGNYYAGTVMKLNDTYTADDSYFLSPVTSESAACRTAIGKLITTVFDDKKAKTDDEIKEVVDKAFKTAYESVVK